MMKIGAIPFDDILARAKAQQDIYDMFTPEEQAEVNAYNHKLIHCTTAQEVEALGPSPFLKYAAKYEK